MIAISIKRYGEDGFSLTAVQSLFRQYNDFIQIPLDFQDFEQELVGLPGKYAPEKRGNLYLACQAQTPVGCAGLYALHPTISEVKRVFVLPSYQGLGIGRLLMEAVISDSQTLGYEKLYLDSLRRFESAGTLYKKLGFVEMPAYNKNPHSDVYYMCLDLTRNGIQKAESL